MAELKDKLVTLEALKYVHDKIEEKMTELGIGDISAEKIVFLQGLKTTYDFGKIKPKNGEVQEIIPAGGNLAQVFEAFVDEMNPTTVKPSASITFNQAGSYEVGASIIPTYQVTFNKGSYTYDPETGVEETKRVVSDSNSNNPPFFPFTVEDNTNYKFSVEISYSDGIIPHTNMGNEYAVGQIKAGSTTATSKAVTGYRNSFYGAMRSKGELSSSVIRGLTKSGKALANDSEFAVDIPVGALRVIIAYPSTLRDISSIKDENGLNAEISSAFSKQTLPVEGLDNYTAIEYKVYILDFAQPNDTQNRFLVKI